MLIGPSRTVRRAANFANKQIAIRAASSIRTFPVLGFPKSGTTWLCQMLATALDLRFVQLPVLPAIRPAVVHGHWPYDPRLRRVTFVIRDGRDTMVSFYFFNKLMHESGEPTAFPRLFPYGTDLDNVRENLPRFIEHTFRNPMGAWLSWPEYNRSWLGRPGVVTTRYETLRAQTEAELARVCEQLGYPASTDRVRSAVKKWSMVRVAGRNPGEEDRSSFVRKGVVGDWVTAFNDESRELFAELAGDALVQFGYERSADWRTWTPENQT